MTIEPTAEPTKPGQKKFGWLAVVAGWFVGNYSWMHMIIPVPAMVLLWLGIVKGLKVEDKMLAGVVSIQGGQAFWFLSGLIFLDSETAPDITVEGAMLLGMSALLLWLRAGWIMIFLLAYQIFSIAVNIYLLVGAPIGSNQHRALAIHILLRGATVFLLSVMLARAYRLRQISRASPA